MAEFMSLAVGLLVPIVVSWIKNQDWPNAAKVLLSLFIAALFGAMTTGVELYREGVPWSWEVWGKNLGLVFTSATVFYKSWFQGTNFDSDLTFNRGPSPSPSHQGRSWGEAMNQGVRLGLQEGPGDAERGDRYSSPRSPRSVPLGVPYRPRRARVYPLKSVD